jgi:hypothetical protein
VETFPITYNGIFHFESVKNTLFYNNYKRKFIICDRFHWCWRNTKKTSKTFSLKYFQIVVETFPIPCISVFCVESVYNTLIYNNYKKKLRTCDRLHWCWRNTKKRTKNLACNISKSWWRPLLLHVLVLFVLNQYRIFYFTIIIRRNSEHVTGCIGVEEIPKKRPKHLAWNISKSWWRPFLSHV